MAIKCPKCYVDNSDTARFCSNCATRLKAGGPLPDSLTKTLETPVHFLEKGALFAGKYRIMEEIGRGGMGVVYKAEDTKLKRTVALKFLPAELGLYPEARERFIREAQSAAALDHPHICTIYEAEEAEGQAYIAMAYIEGQSLRDKLMKGPLNTEEATDIAIRVAEGLEEAHKKGIVHRDVKSANIMVTEKGQTKVMDFGLAKVTGEPLITKEAKTMGTVAYMSPEQARGETVDHRTDIWSLGVVLYEMLSGVLPFKGDYDQTLIHSILHREPERLAKLRKDLPAGLEGIIHKALSKNPAHRYQAMAGMLEDLKAITEGLRPSRGTSLFFRGHILGLKKIYAYPAIAGTVVLAALAPVLLFPTRGQTIDSIAVMPFVNVGGDTNTEYLSDGLSESLINSLARLPNLKVVPRNMAFRYKGKDVDPQKIGKDLNVRSILMGRVFQRGDILNVQTELVDVLKVSQLWGDQYNRKLADIQVVQEEIAAEISDRLRLRLTGAEQKLLTKRYTENPEAYQLYLKGRYYWNRKTEEAFNRGIQCFKQAIDKDPGFALAWAGLADCYNNLGSLGYLAPRDVFPKAKEAATKALELDENLAEAHTSLAVAAMCYGWNWQEAEKEFRRAVKLSPDYATAHSWYGIFLDSMGRFDEGLPELNRARELEPLSLAINTNIGNVHYYFARQYEQAARQLAATLEMDPNFALAHHGLGAVYLAKPILGDALAESQKAAALEKSNPRHLGLLGMAYVAAGKKDEAAKILDELQELSKRRYIPPTSAANILARMAGRRDEAFQELERGYEDRSWIMYQLKVNPIFDPLRTDARFQGLLRRMNFPEK